MVTAEHRIDLYTLLKEQGLLEFLSEEERKRLGLNSAGKGRWWWVTIAICCTTRCIVGMRMSRNPNSHAAKETLHMIMQDKGKWADAVGARSPWDFFGLPELLVTDCGSAFKSFEFRSACEDLGLRVERAIAGLPQMRGVIERLFKTLAFGLLPLLSGRSFSNVIMRGDQDPGDRAVLTENDFAKALIRWVVDIYHNTPHDGLGGATPLEIWRKAEETFGVRSAPLLADLAPIFAKPMIRNLAGDGIRVMGVRYHSEALGRYGIKHAGKKMQIRWYAGDIGSIWVKLADWIKVDAVFDGFKGVRAEDWISAANNLRKSQRRGQEASQEIVHAAIREIAAINAAAQAKAGLVVEDWNDEIMARVEDTLFIGFNVAEAPAEPGTAATRDGIGDAVLPAIEEPVQPKTAPVNPRRIATGTMDLEE